LRRVGPGEHGAAVYPGKDEEELSRKIIAEHKHNGVVSDKIARDRAVPDVRPKQCKNLKYLADLPSVSVVVPFYNEILSTLTRTVHSLINRTPPELLKEIILVNDQSDKKYLYGELEDYLKRNFDLAKVKLIVLPKRSGLILARLAGAKAATGDVLVFLDCHVEVNVNWLPPIIEPIAKNYRTLTCPYIDTIDPDTYRYVPLAHGFRGVFSWKRFNYQHLPLRPGDQLSEEQPFKSPVMVGCAFAISAKFFWELGGYDKGVSMKR
jgi:polypeptide N-acetylgalactosaminyltransferase